MGHKLESVSEEPVAKGKCRHYWVIESPHGPTSIGVCKFCGEEKEFKNFLPGSWFDDSSNIEPVRRRTNPD